jgi:serine/threonine-protein kinase
MPAKIMLRIIKGGLEGRDFAFAERTTCLIGRADDCQLRLPEDEHHRTISRHHCLVDINPPDVRIRDFGSLNGTFVNGQKIGQRHPDQTPEEAALVPFREHDLKDGDEIALDRTVFRVGIELPFLCEGCSREIPDDRADDSERSGGILLCADCSRGTKILGDDVPPSAAKLCAQCGRDVSGQVGVLRHGAFVCDSCKGDPSRLVQLLLKEASSGDKGLQALRGYSLQKELGRGGMGAVFLIRHDATGELQALKLMLPRVAVQPESRERFLRETENTRVLVHRNVVRMRDSGYAHGIFFFTLDYCDGGSVDRLLASRGGTLPVGEAGRIVLQALDGLEYAHNAEAPFVPLSEGGLGRGRGLVHRDFKPQNLFLSGPEDSPVARVGDFGLAKAFDLAGLSGLTASGFLLGTPTFMPRQLVINFKYAKPEVDVWALAATFYRMLTGAPPRDFPRGMDPFLAVLQAEPVPIRRRMPAIPKRLAEVIDHALIDNPAIPFKSAGDFKRVLESLL